MKTLMINKRRPYEDDKPDGYVESDKDFLLNNSYTLVEILEALGAEDEDVMVAIDGNTIRRVR